MTPQLSWGFSFLSPYPLSQKVYTLIRPVPVPSVSSVASVAKNKKRTGKVYANFHLENYDDLWYL
jgi:hypothetical protein